MSWKLSVDGRDMLEFLMRKGEISKRQIDSRFKPKQDRGIVDRSSDPRSNLSILASLMAGGLITMSVQITERGKRVLKGHLPTEATGEVKEWREVCDAADAIDAYRPVESISRLKHAISSWEKARENSSILRDAQA